MRPESGGIPNPDFVPHLNDNLLDLGGRARPAGTALSAPIVFLSDEPPMPPQQGLRCHDCGHLGQKLPSQSFGFGGQSTSLVIAEPQTSVAELFAKNTVLFAQVLDHVKLALIHPSGDSDE
jgi:hypothetical protein